MAGVWSLFITEINEVQYINLTMTINAHVGLKNVLDDFCFILNSFRCAIKKDIHEFAPDDDIQSDFRIIKETLKLKYMSIIQT